VYEVMVPSGSVEVEVKVHVDPAHDLVKLAVGGGSGAAVGVADASLDGVLSPPLLVAVTW
jgi:hypothetical protein